MKILSVLFITLMTAGCSLVNLDPSEDYRTTPREEYEILDQGCPVEIRFVQDVDHYTVEQCVSIGDQDGKMKIKRLWEDDRTLKLIPLKEPLPGWEYRLDFNGFYSTSTGKSMESKLSLPFYWIRSDFSPLEVLSSRPSEGGIISENGIIEISFSSDVDEASLSRGLSISPDLEVDRTWTGKTLTLTPSEHWENLTTYTIKISNEVKDTEGNRLFPEWESSFYVETGSSIPYVLSLGSCRGDISSDFPVLSADLGTLAPDQALRVRFSESMDRSTTESAFSLTPSLAGDLFWSEDPLRQGIDDLVFLPRDGFLMSQSYRLVISSSAKGKTGIAMSTGFVKDFTADIEEQSLLSLECLSYGGFILSSFSADTAYDLPSGPVSPFNLSFRLTFSRPFTSDQEKQMVQDRLNIYEIFSSGGSPRAGLYSWASDYSMTVLFSGFTADTDSDYYYILELPGGEGGIINSEGSFFPSDIRQLFRVARL